LVKKGAVVIGLCGDKFAGKDYVGKVIGKITRIRDESHERVAFGDPIKKVASIIFDVPLALFYAEERVKENHLTVWKWSELEPGLAAAFPGGRGVYVTVREAVQLVGYELFRKRFAEQTWIKLIRAQLERSDKDVVVVTDVRFEPEEQLVRTYGGWIVRVVDPEAPVRVDQHKTETSQWVIKPDHTIINSRLRPPHELEQELTNYLFPTVKTLGITSSHSG
jgi:hypothetical protein